MISFISLFCDALFIVFLIKEQTAVSRVINRVKGAAGLIR